MTELAAGLTGERSARVEESNTALSFGSGLAPVFSTPYLVALMEGAAVNAIAPALSPEQGSVGTMIQVNHKAATPVGMTVTAKARLEEVDGRRLVFSVEAWDDKELVGDGKHERFIINNEKFLAKAEAKKLTK